MKATRLGPPLRMVAQAIKRVGLLTFTLGATVHAQAMETAPAHIVAAQRQGVRAVPVGTSAIATAPKLGKSLPMNITVVEFYNAALDSYVVTGRRDEIAALDQQGAFQRTGASFETFVAGTGPVGTEDVCRFGMSASVAPSPALSSLFYGRKSTDCAALFAAGIPTLRFDGYDFATYVPQGGGTCPAYAPLKIYRSFRGQTASVNSNHRYTLSRRDSIAMAGKGWTDEGVVMCAVSGVAASGEAKADVVRMLEQSTLGPTEAAVKQVAAQGFTRWLDEQLAMNVTRYTQPAAWDPPIDSRECFDDPTPPVTPEKYCAHNKQSHAPIAWDFYRQSRTAPDQLRLRMAHVWHQIMVLGEQPTMTYAAAEFHQRLRDNVFATYEELLFKFAISPQMGLFQNWVLNLPEHDGIRPNENFARELMQLFSIGVNELNDDGSPKLDASGNLIPSYVQADIESLARVLTGFSFPARPDDDKPYFRQRWYFVGDMIGYDEFHDQNAKSLFSGALKFPPNNGALADLKLAIRGLVNHPNTPAFISKQLIQKTVTSNPSRSYVARIAAVFKNNGKGVRGDLAAVTRAMLLDDEARGAEKSDPTYGRLREPALLWTALIRALDIETDGAQPHATTGSSQQTLFNPESVFSYYPSTFTLIGSNIPAPEFGIFSTSEFLNRANLINDILYHADQPGAEQHWGAKPYVPNALGTASPALTPFLPDAANAPVLIERLDQLFLHGTMRADMREALIAAVNTVATSDPVRRVKMAINLIVTSIDYQVQK